MFRSRIRSQILIRTFQKAVNYFPKFIMNKFPETMESKLKNGLTVISENWHTEMCTVGLWINIGSRCENDSNNGVAHFLEHMYFKGTNKRNHLQIQNEAVKKGVILKSYMTREMISIYANCHKDDIEWAVSLLGEIITEPKYEDTIFEKEKINVIKEMQELEKNYREVVFDYLHAAAFQGTPLSRSIIGTEESIQNMTSKTLLDFLKNFYKAPKMVLVGVGEIEHRNLDTLAQKYLGDVSCNYENGIDTNLPCRFTSSDIRDRDDALPLGHVAIAFEGPNIHHADSVPLLIATAINGSYDKTHGGTIFTASEMAAKSFNMEDLRSFQNFFLPYTHSSLWGFYYTATGSEMFDISFFIMSYVRRVCGNISEFEVNRAKNQLKTNMVMNLSGSENICDDIGRQMMTHGVRIGIEDMINNIDGVNAHSVRSACLEYLYNKSPAMVGYGPIEGLPDLNLMFSKTWWLRY